MVWDLWCFEDVEEKERWLNQSVNDGGVCRTAPATPVLLNISDTLLNQKSPARLVPVADGGDTQTDRQTDILT